MEKIFDSMFKVRQTTSEINSLQEAGSFNSQNYYWRDNEMEFD
jgi:hypothetical protein